MKRFRVEVYGRRKLESGEWGRCVVKEFFVNVWHACYEITTKNPWTPVTQVDADVAAEVYLTHTTILTERFFSRPFTEYRVSLES